MKRNAAIFFFGLICGFFVFSYLLSDRWLNSFRKSENIQRIELARVKILHDFDEINPAVKLYLGVLDTAYKETNCKDVSAPKHTEVEAPLIEKMPFPWPKQNVVVRKQPFNPIVFSDNTYSLMCHKDKFTTKWIQKFTDQILDELERWLVKDGKAVFFYYNFKYHPLDYDLPIKWRSAFAQGHILKGLTHLDSITNSKRVKRLLKGVFNSLNPSGRNYEVTFLDDHGYIWFDEYPLPGSRPTSYVLNGHIWALLGVYYYWVHTRDLRAQRLLRGGIETVKDHWMDFRFRKSINCYDLRTCEKDYAFDRASNQMHWLYGITGHTIFKRAALNFAYDVESEKNKKQFLKSCKSGFLNRIYCIWNPMEFFDRW